MHRPRKRFGQNFLHDQQVIDRIIAAADLQPGDRILEIGPGPGALTERLLATELPVLAVEIDRDLAENLRQRGLPNLEVITGDVLRLDWSQLLTAPPYKLIANLPYNISSQVLFKILDYRRLLVGQVLMFQKEVGDRLVAPPDCRDYGILSVLMQTWFEIDKVVKVPPGAFYPPPKVDSLVLRLSPRPAPRWPILDEVLYRRLVRSAFAQRRKTLRNSLLGSGWPATQVDQAFDALGIDARRRGETLTLEEYASLANHFVSRTEGD
ncbi:MAG: 16S rRNA (adenine(1518)-N(6)/adenine(1519)-N(6))-dimethyltransferase RsmA [Desulfuromonadales bacterium]